MSKKKTKKVNPYAKKPQKKNYLPLVAIIGVICLAIVACVAIVAGNQDDAPVSQPTAAPVTLTGTHKIEIDIQDYGTIKAELYADIAPITVDNFIKLAKEGFYDGLTFHRIVEGFMMQGGDPEGNGTGGSGKTITGEFKANGIENDLLHTRGAISMARSKDYNSASSQFFIVHQDSTHLDGSYAVFGYVTEGMDVVDEICGDANPVDNNGSIAKNDQPVIESITIRR